VVGVGNIVSVGGVGGSGGGGSGSGIQSLNDQTGPNVNIKGGNGVTVSVSGENCLVISASGTTGGSQCFSESFGPTTSGFFAHNFGTRNVLVQVIDDSSPPQVLFPDAIQHDTLDGFSVRFNRPQSGTVIATACGGSNNGSSDVQKYTESFTSSKSVSVNHGLSTEDVIVQVYSNSRILIPDDIVIQDENNLVVTFNRDTSGKIVVIG